ncbi:hypothetical protein [Saccharicrinis sp. FJH54]
MRSSFLWTGSIKVSKENCTISSAIINKKLYHFALPISKRAAKLSLAAL